ncbi:major facilitator superfamily protein [Colletotrichum tabaci]|uniref:Major facilitator superfamily protein n=1 Tax=Colletotrichum tabaci TaxID=1209068 RepID=A0AAV9TQ78_9PEZI
MAQSTDPGTSPMATHEPLQAPPARQASTDQQVIENDHAEPATPWTAQGWRFWAAFHGLYLAMLTGLDASILATSLPTIVSDLHGGALYIWAMNGYSLTTAVVQPLMGQAADIFGRRIPMLVSLSLFTLGSGLCGTSTSLPMLIAARLIQGFGGGGSFVMTDTIIADLTPFRDRVKYVSMVMIFFTVGSILGPVSGGAIVDNTTWCWVFYINLPVCAAALPLVFLFLRVNRKREGTIAKRLGRVDYSGNFILVCAVISIIIPLAWGGTTYSWRSWHILLPLVDGFAGLVFFGIPQGKFAREPIMPLRVYSNMSCALGYGITFLHGIVLGWLSFFLPVYFQILLESTPLQSGVKLLAVVIPLAPAGMAGGIAIALTGHYKMVIVAGFVLLSIAVGCMTTLDANSSTAVWIVFHVLAGLVSDLSLTATLPAVQAPVPASDVAIATAAWAFARSFGAIWGAAIPSAVFNSRFDKLPHFIPEPSFDAQPVLKEQIIHVYTEAFKRVWVVLIPFAIVPIGLALCMKEVELRKELKTDFGLKETPEAQG